MLLVPELGTAALLLAVLLWPALRPSARPGTMLLRVIALAGLGALASAVVQRKGWSYHDRAAGTVHPGAGGTAGGAPARRAGGGAALRAPVLVAALGLAFVVWSGEINEAPLEPARLTATATWRPTALLRRTAEGERVLVLSPQISPIFPALNYAHAPTRVAHHEHVDARGQLSDLPGGRAALPRNLAKCRPANSSSSLPSPRISPRAPRRRHRRSLPRHPGLQGRALRLHRLFLPPSAVRRGLVALPPGRRVGPVPPVRAPRTRECPCRSGAC